VVIARGHGGLDGGIQCGERVVELTRPELGLRDEAQPLAIKQAGTGLVPGGQAPAKLGDPLSYEDTARNPPVTAAATDG